MDSRVAIICSYPVPEGMAATTRIMAYAKGMVKCGASVEVYSYVPSGANFAGTHGDKGQFEGVSFQYTFRRKRLNNGILHKVEGVYSLMRLYKILKSKNKERNYDAIIVSNDNPLVLLYISQITKLLRTKCIFIFDEYPIPIRKYLKNNITQTKAFAYKKSLKQVDAFISMTTNLASFYCGLVKRPALIVSSITDIDRFTTMETPETGNKKKITYMGNLELSKDNVDNIIRGFKGVAELFLDVDLYLYGKPSAKDKAFLDELIKTSNLKNRVHFGFVSYKGVPTVLASSHILVSSQPNSKRAEGGFPTKLGEYMATSIPVLLTDVGEISSYVTHKKNVFLAQPEDPEDYAAKLIYILENYSLAKQVAAEGNKLVKEKYSHIIAGKKILNFINKLK